MEEIYSIMVARKNGSGLKSEREERDGWSGGIERGTE